MIKQLLIISTLLTFVACQNNSTSNQFTKLEKFITETDSLTSNSEIFDQITYSIQTKKPEFKEDSVTLIAGDTIGLLKEKIFRFYFDKTGQYKEQYSSINIKQFNSNRHAAKAFLKIIESYACCIPDEDIIKLKNFENLELFKNSASTTILTENIIIEAELGEKIKSNKKISELLDEILSKRKYLKLEIGNGGPAIWTRK